MLVFFFSSRRRHTRYIGDWSSDVCSSDLSCARREAASSPGGDVTSPGRGLLRAPSQIGRASCRERVWISAVAAALKKERIKQRVQARTVGISTMPPTHEQQHITECVAT